jgi:hypothetical protein
MVFSYKLEEDYHLKLGFEDLCFDFEQYCLSVYEAARRCISLIGSLQYFQDHKSPYVF